jgi:putative acetyltransferase
MHEPIATPGAVADQGLTVVRYRKELRPAFEQLNRAWIERYFVLEDADRAIFADPAGTILGPGGEIFFVVRGDAVLGTCAVIRHSPAACEIAKMAVAPAAQGKGLGDLLMHSAVAFAREIGASRVAIVSNTVLKPALHLYRKHGFVQVPWESDGRYHRANIRMELDLEAGPVMRPGEVTRNIGGN